MPAPEMAYGLGPDELAREVLGELGLSRCEPALVETESFTTPGGWHCMFHYWVELQQAITPNAKLCQMGVVWCRRITTGR